LASVAFLSGFDNVSLAWRLLKALCAGWQSALSRPSKLAVS